MDEVRQIQLIWCLLESYVPNQGDVWSHILSELKLYFERVLSRKTENPRLPDIPVSLTEAGYFKAPALVQNLIGSVYSERSKLLGICIAELHLALSSEKNSPGFALEEFSMLYQRSLYQSIRANFRRTITLLKAQKENLLAAIQNLVSEILKFENQMLIQLQKFLHIKIDTLKTRIHGDYHLGQVIYNGKDFIIIDFEGEPVKAPSERRLKQSGIRDIAGMFRSF